MSFVSGGLPPASFTHLQQCVSKLLPVNRAHAAMAGDGILDAAPTHIAECPVCHSGESRKVYDLSAAEAAQHFVLREQSADRNRQLEMHIRRLWAADHCSIHRCAVCGFGFAHPYIAGDVAFYNLAYERTGYPGDKWEYRRTLEELSSMGFLGRRILEAGSGFGMFLDRIANRYVPRSGITALEYSDQAIEVLRQKNYSVLQQDLRTMDMPGPLDAIFLFQVLEHLDGLDRLFARLAELLCDGGALFIAVPNPKRMWFNEENGSLLDCPPNHIGRWSPDALRTIGSRHGLRLERHETEPFSLRDFIVEDIKYFYLRRSQRPGTLANRSRAHRSATGGKAAEVLVAAAQAPLRMPTWLKAARASGLGGSLWAKFTKPGGPGAGPRIPL
jgi:SAM-dependent methyltransferase